MKMNGEFTCSSDLPSLSSLTMVPVLLGQNVKNNMEDVLLKKHSKTSVSNIRVTANEKRKNKNNFF